MKLLAEIGVILAIISKAIFKYMLFPIIIVTSLALLFPDIFYGFSYIFFGTIVSVTIVSFAIYIVSFGIGEMIINKCIQRSIGEIRGYNPQNKLDFYPMNIETAIRIKKIERIRNGIPVKFVKDGFNLLSDKILTACVFIGIISISVLLVS
jgi:hypothetical protein